MNSSGFLWVGGVSLFAFGTSFVCNRIPVRAEWHGFLQRIGLVLLIMALGLMLVLNLEDGPLAVYSQSVRAALTLICAFTFMAGAVFIKRARVRAPGDSNQVPAEPPQT